MSRLFPKVADKITPVFLCCDLQEKFAARIPRFNDAVFEANRFSKVAEELKAPFIVTEQYPKGLGHTVSDIKLPSTAPPPFAKSAFSMITPEVEKAIGSHKHFVLWGIEAHVCVQQTVDDLISADRDNRVWIVSNGTFSQHEVDRLDALEWFRHTPGVAVTTSESLLMQFIRGKDHPNFKFISGLLRERQPSERQ